MSLSRGRGRIGVVVPEGDEVSLSRGRGRN